MATASGFLDSENVVFYHPLDSYTDGIQSDIWAGSAFFGPAIISSGINSATSSGPIVSSGLSQPNVYNEGSWLVPISGGSNKAVFIHWQAVGPDGMYAKVVTVDNSDNISVGTDSVLPVTSFTNLNRGTRQFVNISGNRFVGAFARNNAWYIDVVTLDVNGDTVTWNTPTTITGQSAEFYNAGYSMDIAVIPNAPSGGFLVTYYENVAFPDESGLYIKYGRVADNGDIVLESGINVDAGREGRLVVLNQDKAVMTYIDRANSDRQVMRLVNISGMTLTFGDKITVYGGLDTLPNWIWGIDSSGFYTANANSVGNSILFTTHSVSGDNITIISSGTIDSVAAPTRAVASYFPISGTKGVLNWHQVSYGIGAVYFRINDDYELNIGSRTDYNLGSVPSHGQVSATILDNDRYLVFSDDKNLLQILTEPSNTIYSQSGNLYPAISGASGITVGSWTNMSNSSNTLLSIERDCDISITSGDISFCSGSLYWNDMSVISWINSISDESDHLIFLDFRYQGSDNWKLYTSLDGAPWVDQGIQNSGTHGEIITDTVPRIIFSNDNFNQLLDEVIIWKDVEQFSSLELAKLHALGQIYDLPMDQYSNTKIAMPFSGSVDLCFNGMGYEIGSAPLFTCAPPPDIYNSRLLYLEAPKPMLTSGNLFIHGHEDIFISEDLLIHGHIDENASGDLFISGCIEASGIIGRPLDWLIKTSDHNPQIIGTIKGATNVNIQIWEITDSQNTTVSIASSICYQIGQTGRWGWSTANLPVSSARRAQYFYVMIANNNDIFTGQFFMDVPEEARWIHPDNLDDHLIQQ